MPGIQGIGPKRRYRRAVLATRPPLVQARGGVGRGPKRPKNKASRRFGLNPVPDFPGWRLKGPDRPANRASNSTIWLARGIPQSAIAPTPGETQYARESGTPDGRMMKDVKDTREARLKQALRENLKRRKSQARGRSDEAAASSETADASLDDASGEEPGQQ